MAPIVTKKHGLTQDVDKSWQTTENIFTNISAPPGSVDKVMSRVT